MGEKKRDKEIDIMREGNEKGERKEDFNHIDLCEENIEQNDAN